MPWKKTWEAEAVLALLGGIVAALFFGALAAGLLRQAGVAGFRSEGSVGSVLLATLSFHGAAILLGTIFLKFHDSSWREVLGRTGWKHCLALACVILVLVAPLICGLKWVSDLALLKLHRSIADQNAVELILGAKPWLRCYLFFFAVILAPAAEEFVFRGLLFATAKRYGWPRAGWIGVSLLFALVHFNAPTFLPLFVLALALTWLYEVTEGLLAPILAHSLFNAANLVLLLIAEKYNLLGP
ncbi:MAG: CPBP family intramembrane glutamic endopeptidase [Verrucomicrobiota bacterium]|jgi:membrane protease YdiL (CAAX protease family)